MACSSPATQASAPQQTTNPAHQPVAQDKSDYLVLVPRAFEKAITPLVTLRTKQGHFVAVHVAEDVYAKYPSASHEEALLADVRATAVASPPLHFVLLAGDPRADGAQLPTFHRQLGQWVGHDAGKTYATDHPYALFPEHPLAVGRLPARTFAELEGMVGKIAAYESDGAAEWGRRVLFFGGPPNFNALLDEQIEKYARHKLDEEVPHEFGLGVLFAKPSSPYVYRLDKLGAEISSEMSGGALLAIFVGHGSPQSFDRVRYRDKPYVIGTARDFAAVDAAHGNPIFIAITCSAGEFDAPARSIVETAMLNPKGAVASFGSAAFSGAYANSLVSDELLDSFLVTRSPTIGDAILRIKQRLPNASSALKYAFKVVGDGLGDTATSDEAVAEHLFLYNLFGDPATRPAYPENAVVKPHVDAPSSGGGASTSHGPISVAVTLPHGGFTHVEVTLETERTHLKDGIVEPEALDALGLDAAFETMVKNHALAVDPVVARVTAEVQGESAVVHLDSPPQPGTYWVRAIATGGGRAAAGAERVEVP